MRSFQNGSPSRIRRIVAGRIEACRESAEEGQALIFALIVVLLMGLLPAIVLTSLTHVMPYVSEAVSSESALAAAEAGVQEYANLMDQYTGYFKFAPQAGGATSTNDPGLPGGNNLALGAWENVTPSNPPESFTYYPDTSETTTAETTANPFGADVLLVVTGRAGTGKTMQYRRIEAAFSLSGVITDVYFSNFEQPGSQDLDQWENTFNAGCTSGCSVQTSGAHEYDEATDTTPCVGANCYAPAEPMATALCEYDADQQNTFIDWYSTYVTPITPQPGYPGYDTHTAYSAANPYYGPWYGSFTDPTDAALQFGEAPTTGSTNNGDQSACNTNYWITGDTFNGPVFSNDELTTCGVPAFTGTPSLQTSITHKFPFPAEKTAGGTLVGWPGANLPVVNPKGAGYVSYPFGYDKDPWGDCASGADKPTFKDPQAPRFGVSQQLPAANQALVSEIKAGTVAGCVYTGPTMIRFSWNAAASSEIMSVWSPLTKDTYTSQGSGIGQPIVVCGQTATSGADDLCAATAPAPCTAANTQVNSTNTVVAGNFAQVPVTGQEVIAVQNLPSAAVDPNNNWPTLPTAEALPNATIAGCIDPWVNPDSGAAITPVTCTEGDAIVSGAVGAQVTISSSNDIVIARSLVYGCAVQANLTYSSTLAGCTNSNNVIGLIALNDIWMARPVTNNVDAPACTDDKDLQPASITWSTMVPNCTVSNPIIDAASAALQGFFEAEYWREGGAVAGLDTLTFNGSDAVNAAGQFGTFSGSTLYSGYLLNLNYDSRLLIDPPPAYLPATDGVWNQVGWVTCGTTLPNPDSSASYPPATVPPCAPLAGTFPPS
jgi:type II secretory pathway pseudopilin PulG